MRVLVGCEFSGKVRDAFARRGHDAWSCDLLPSESPGQHYQGDLRDFIASRDWDIGIFHPPCTYILNSGCRWLYQGGSRYVYDDDGQPIGQNSRDPVRWKQMEDGAEFFKFCLEAPIDKICVENPIMVGHALNIIGTFPSQVIQPWQFGHPETKATCLWLKNLPKLQPTDIVYYREQRIHNLPRTPDRGKIRSVTYSGVAKAMAAQWSDDLT